MNKHELSQLFYLCKEIKSQEEMLKMLESKATSITSKISDMPHGTSVSDLVGKYGTDIVYYKNMLEVNKRKRSLELQRLYSYINSLDDSFIRQIFTHRYIDHLKWNQIAQRMGCTNSPDGLRKIHDRFLEKQKKTG